MGGDTSLSDPTPNNPKKCHMKNPPRIALVHATRLAIDPVEAAAQEHWPQAETISILEESLSVDRLKSKELSPDLHRRIIELTRYAEAAEADGVLFTCSAFGAAIEQANGETSTPVMKPNEAMFEAAFRYGNRVTMLYTFPPAAAGMEEEFREAAQAKGSDAKITSVFCDGAMDAKRAGDIVKHNKLLADTARGVSDADVILLGQFSMASAAPEIRECTDIPVLTSPESAIQEIRRRVETTTDR